MQRQPSGFKNLTRGKRWKVIGIVLLAVVIGGIAIALLVSLIKIIQTIGSDAAG